MDTIKSVLYSIWGVFKTIGLNDIVDIMILSYLFFHIMKLIRETRALQLAKGILLLVGSYLFAVVFNLQTLKFLLKICFQWGFVALIILFQPELRRMLERVGRSKIADIALFKPSDDEQDAEHIRSAIRAVCDASMKLSSTRTGALIIFERKTKLGEQIATGTLLDCVPSAAMLGNIFVPNTPLHDGAVIIRDGKILATCFYEPSTRTRLSFESAMLRLGGQVLGFATADSSSAAKGESVSDTIRIISSYADICAMRHPKEGAPMVAASKSWIPVINAGDGGHQHPTQTLTDLMTIRSLKGSLSNMTIGLCGDLKFGRTVHSLINALIRYENVSFVFISPPELKIPDYIREDVLIKNNVKFEEVIKLDDVMPKLDILYMTRVQRERFFNEEDYVRLKDFYVLNKEKMALAKKDMMVLHPLPRVNEISVEVDEDERAMYFKQVRYGMYIRMALILTLLEIE